MNARTISDEVLFDYLKALTDSSQTQKDYRALPKLPHADLALTSSQQDAVVEAVNVVAKDYFLSERFSAKIVRSQILKDLNQVLQSHPGALIRPLRNTPLLFQVTPNSYLRAMTSSRMGPVGPAGAETSTVAAVREDFKKWLMQNTLQSGPANLLQSVTSVPQELLDAAWWNELLDQSPGLAVTLQEDILVQDEGKDLLDTQMALTTNPLHRRLQERKDQVVGRYGKILDQRQQSAMLTALGFIDGNSPVLHRLAAGHPVTVQDLLYGPGVPDDKSRLRTTLAFNQTGFGKGWRVQAGKEMDLTQDAWLMEQYPDLADVSFEWTFNLLASDEAKEDDQFTWRNNE